MASVRQSNFAGGELAPALYGRSDLPAYAKSLRRCRNFIPTNNGRAVSRPGTVFLREVKDSSLRTRLIPFIYSEADSVALEFGNLYVRFHGAAAAEQYSGAAAYSAASYYNIGRVVTSGGIAYKSIQDDNIGHTPVSSPTWWSVVSGTVEVVTPYATADLPKLKFAQVGDVLWLAHPSYAPRTLTRYGASDWVLLEVSHDILEPSLGVEPPSIVEPYTTGGDNQEWVWLWSIIAQDRQTGSLFETAALHVTQSTDDVAYPATTWTAISSNYIELSTTNPVKLKAMPTFGLLSVPDGYGTWRALSVNFYRGRGRLFGFVGETTPESFGTDIALFVDVGIDPDYTRQPKSGRNPFEVYDASDVLLRTEHPNCLTFFEQRLCLGGTTQRPQTFWASWTDDYRNFDVQIPATVDTSVEFELAAMRREEIRSMAGLDRCFVLTGGGVWTIAGNGGPLTYNSIQALKHTDESASWVAPLVAGDTLLYVRSKGGGVNQVAFDQGRQKCDVVDLSALARHLVDAGDIEEWAYAHDPYKLIWAVRDDGLLLSLTYDRAAECVAWAWHDTAGWEDDEAGFESVITLPGTSEDEVWVIARRTIDGGTERYIERFSSRMVTAAEDAICSDCALTYDGAATDTITGLDHLEGETVQVLADGVVMAARVVTGGEITLDAEAELVQVGLGYTPQVELLDLASGGSELHTRQKNVTKVVFDVESSRGLKAGQNFDELKEWRQRDVSDSYEVLGLFTGQAPVAIAGGWNTNGRAVLQQDDPLPVTILGVTREVVLGDTNA